MKSERLATALTLINLLCLGVVFVEARSTMAQNTASVLRGHALEIVDDRGRVRATITVEPASPAVSTPSGSAYPETVLLRLIDPNGRPGVKVSASERGSGLSFVGEFDRTHVVVKAEGSTSTLKLMNQDGRVRLLEP